jgi:hypothetical protein
MLSLSCCYASLANASIHVLKSRLPSLLDSMVSTRRSLESDAHWPALWNNSGRESRKLLAILQDTCLDEVRFHEAQMDGIDCVESGEELSDDFLSRLGGQFAVIIESRRQIFSQMLKVGSAHEKLAFVCDKEVFNFQSTFQRVTEAMREEASRDVELVETFLTDPKKQRMKHIVDRFLKFCELTVESCDFGKLWENYLSKHTWQLAKLPMTEKLGMAKLALKEYQALTKVIGPMHSTARELAVIVAKEHLKAVRQRDTVTGRYWISSTFVVNAVANRVLYLIKKRRYERLAVQLSAVLVCIARDQNSTLSAKIESARVREECSESARVLRDLEKYAESTDGQYSALSEDTMQTARASLQKLQGAGHALQKVGKAREKYISKVEKFLRKIEMMRNSIAK